MAGRSGVGYRRDLAADILMRPESVGFLEVVAECCFADRSARREAIALSDRWPVVPHGVKLSLASASGIDAEKVELLASLARELGAPVVSEHVALTSAGGREIGHLMPAPRTEALLRVVAKNVARLRSALPDVPLLLENIAAPFGFADDAIPEAELYCRIVESTGCDLLLDVANLYANAVNRGEDPLAVARNFPLDRVGMIHLAGGVFEDGFYFDTHAHPVPDAVFEVLAAVLAVNPEVPILLERDAHFDAGIAPLLSELDRASGLRPAKPAPAPTRRPAGALAATQAETEEDAGLARDQAMLASLLLDEAPARGTLAESIGLPEIERARRILERKRIEDALPLLPRLARRGHALWPLAERALAGAPRTPRLQAVCDALRIAEAVIGGETATLADDARRDRLPLLTRFAMGRDAPSARKGPFVSRERLSGDAVIWAVKGFGANAPVYLHERGHRREGHAR